MFWSYLFVVVISCWFCIVLEFICGDSSVDCVTIQSATSNHWLLLMPIWQLNKRRRRKQIKAAVRSSTWWIPPIVVQSSASPTVQIQPVKQLVVVAIPRRGHPEYSLTTQSGETMGGSMYKRKTTTTTGDLLHFRGGNDYLPTCPPRSPFWSDQGWWRRKLSWLKPILTM